MKHSNLSTDSFSDGLQKECLKSLESLCVFGYCEFYKNLLCILVELHNQIYHKYTPVPKRMMEMFGVSNQLLVAHMIRRGKFETTKFSQAYRMDIKISRLMLEIVLPVQFNLLWEHYLQRRHLLTKVELGGIQPMLLIISK